MNTCNHEIVDENCSVCMLKFYKDELEYQRETLGKIKSIASDLYADRGEDAKTALACNRIIIMAGM